MNSWKASDLDNKPAPIPVIAPRTGPPGKNNEANIPAPAPFLITSLFSWYKFINDSGITPPALLPSSSNSPNIQRWKVSDCANKLVDIPTTAAPKGPPGNNILPNAPNFEANNVLNKALFKPSLAALGNLSLTCSVRPLIDSLGPFKKSSPNSDTLN